MVETRTIESLMMIPVIPSIPTTVNMLSGIWRTLTLFNPVVYLVSGFRWSFYGQGDVPVLLSLGFTLGFLLLCMAGVWWIFRTGYRIKV